MVYCPALPPRENEDLTFYNLVYSKFAQRLQEARGFYKEILKYPFDYNKDETFDIDYDKKIFPKNEIELIINWQKQLKLITISRLHDKLVTEEGKKKEDSNYKAKSFEGIEIDARKETLKGVEIEPRRLFIEENAKYVENLDI
jgi:carboxyl-terminal processing protease